MSFLSSAGGKVLGRARTLLGGKTPEYVAPRSLRPGLELQTSEAGQREQQAAARRNQLLQTADIALGDTGVEQQLYEDELGNAISGIGLDAADAQRQVQLGAVRRGKRGSSTEEEAQAGVKNQQATAVADAVASARAALFNRQSARRNTLAQLRAQILSGDQLTRQAELARGQAFDVAGAGATQAGIDRTNYTNALNRIGDARSRTIGDFLGSFSGAGGTLAAGAA